MLRQIDDQESSWAGALNCRLGAGEALPPFTPVEDQHLESSCPGPLQREWVCVVPDQDTIANTGTAEPAEAHADGGVPQRHPSPAALCKFLCVGREGFACAIHVARWRSRPCRRHRLPGLDIQRRRVSRLLVWPLRGQRTGPTRVYNRPGANKQLRTTGRQT